MSQYPVLFSSQPSERRTARARQTVDAINAAREVGSIANVEFNELKRFANDMVEYAWHKRVSEEYMWGGRFETLPKAVLEFERSLSIVSSTTTARANLKRLNKYKGPDHPMIHAMRGVLEEADALGKSLEALKPLIVKGRRRRAENEQPARPENPNKVVKTCACCFRGIAVGSDGTMVNHGYRRPGTGFLEGGCPGKRFRPLEVSDDGLVFMIDAHRRERDRLTDYAQRLEDGEVSSLMVSVRAPHSWRMEVRTITPEDTEWTQALRQEVAQTKSHRRYVASALTDFEDRHRSWKRERGIDDDSMPDVPQDATSEKTAPTRHS